MIQYLVDDYPGRPGTKYGLSYSSLQEDWWRFTEMSNEEFMKNLPDAAHFACIVCWLKETPSDHTVGDQGIVHQLIHIMTIPDYRKGRELRKIRSQFKRMLKLN